MFNNLATRGLGGALLVTAGLGSLINVVVEESRPIGGGSGGPGYVILPPKAPNTENNERINDEILEITLLLAAYLNND